MKFHCGETCAAKKARLGAWHRKFALLPRTVGEENGEHVCVWLDWYERRGEFMCGWNDSWWEWEYRVPQELRSRSMTQENATPK